MNEVIRNIKSRRSCRGYKDAQISIEDLNEILECALCGPSGMNTQGCHYVAVQNQEILKELNIAVKNAFKEIGDPRGSNENYNFYYNALTLIIAVAKKDYKYFFTDGSAGLENMFLDATSLGLGSCWINQLKDTCDYPEIRRILDNCNIPSDYGVIGCASIGYASKEVVKPSRMENRIYIVK